MAEFELPDSDVNKYQVQDGSRDEALLKTLNDIVINTGGDALNGGVVNKFGFNNDIDTAAVEVIASQGGSIAIMTTAGTLDCVSSSTEDDTGGTGASLILISGVDENNLAITEYVTLDGVTPVTTTNSFLGVNRVVVITTGSNDANVGNITIDDTANAVGIQAYIPAGLSVTQQCIYHVPISRTFALEFINLSAIKISGGGGVPVANIKGWSYSRVTDTNYNVIDFEIDLSVENNVVIPYSNPIIFTGREVIYFTASTDINNTKISLRFSGAETNS
jgi:hypothetical protein